MTRLAAPTLAAALALTLPAAAQEVGSDIEAGAGLFTAHCAYCHGMGGRGDGPEAARLNPQPKDLTVLKAGNDGVFPVLRVIRRIDGRDSIVAHGSPMPVFGAFFEGEDAMLKVESGQPILTSRPVADLVAWLESVQE
jgi:mono/diheme cytochrome c family protein